MDFLTGKRQMNVYLSTKIVCNTMMDWINYQKNDACVDSQVVIMMRNEVRYWIDVLKRILIAIRFLSERDLPFRGSNEKFGLVNNGNYLGVLETIAEFDPFLKQHILTYANKGRRKFLFHTY